MTCSKSRVYNLLKELRCATALEIATRLGMSRKVVQTYLNRLVAKGLVEKRMLGRRAVMYCAKEGCPGGGGRRRRGGDAYELYTATRKRLTHVLEILRREGCVSVGSLMRTLDVSHTKAYHMARILLLTHKGVKVKIGNTAVLCRDRIAAEETASRLRDAIHKIAVQNGMRYATASKVLLAVLKVRETYELFSKFIPLRRNMTRFPPLVLTFVRDILRSLYGEPLKAGNRRVYVVAQQTRAEHGFEIIDHVDRYTLAVNLPNDLAAVLQDASNETVLQALEQLLARYRS